MVYRHGMVGFGITVVLLMAFAGCEDEAGPPGPRYEADSREFGELPLSGQSVVRSISSKGMVTFRGEGIDIVRWYLFKYTSASTQIEADQALAQISTTHTTVADTLIFDVLTPASGEVTCNGALTLNVPSGVVCDVENAARVVFAADLFNDLRVRGSDSVAVERHTGSCDVAVGSGGLFIEIAVPDTGYCLAQTGNGNIELHVPVTSSAELVARTGSGSITIDGLTLTGRVDSAGYVSGTLGGGTATIRLETVNGNIIVKGLP